MLSRRVVERDRHATSIHIVSMATEFPGYLNISRDEAKVALQEYKNKDGYFLIRPSTTNGLYTISVVSGANIMKYPVHNQSESGLFYVNQTSRFPSMLDLVNHYRLESISSNNQVLLREPVNGWPRGARGEYGVFVRRNDSRQPTSRQPPTLPPSNRQPTTTLPGAARQPLPSPVHGRQPQATPGVPQLPQSPRPGPKQNQFNLPPPQQQQQPPQQQTPQTLPPRTAKHLNGQASPPRNGTVPIHDQLPREMVAKVFQPYMGKNGCFLIRPSSTSDGKLTLCVTSNGSIVNFKISRDSKGEFRITTKSFTSLEDLVSGYMRHPIKSKKKQEEIFLTEPIPLSAYSGSSDSPPSPTANQSQGDLPDPWVRYVDKASGKPYYFNRDTKKTQWDPPSARSTSAASPPRRPKSASLCETSSQPAAAAAKKESPYASRPLPTLPSLPGQVSRHASVPAPSSPRGSPHLGRRTPERNSPTTRSLADRQLPSLPFADSSSSSPPPQALDQSCPARLPGQPAGSMDHLRSSAAEPQQLQQPPRGPAVKKNKTPPPLPQKELSQTPPLPRKDTLRQSPPHLPGRVPPPLPTKIPEGSEPPPTTQPHWRPSQTPPPLPQKGEESPRMNRAPSLPKAPPPVPPIITHSPPPASPVFSRPPPPSPGAPPPPPPPPLTPPPPALAESYNGGTHSLPVTPDIKRSRTLTANDLSSARFTLKHTDKPQKKGPAQLSGMGGALSSALDKRRVFVQNSDSECEEAEDDDWND